MKWRCESHDAGWLIVVEIDHGVCFANHLGRDQMKSAHDPAWVFWSAIRSLTRAVRNYGNIDAAMSKGDQV